MTVNMVSACLCFIFYAGLNIIGYKLYIVVKKNRQKQNGGARNNDSFMLAMIFILTLEVLSKGFFYIFNFYDWKWADLKTGCMWSVNHLVLQTVCMYMSVTFLSIGITINVRNWLYYYIKINEMAEFKILNFTDDNTAL